MHRGTSYLSMGSFIRSDSSKPAATRNPNTLSRGIAYLIIATALIFLLSPAPNTHPGGAGGGLIRQPDEHVSSTLHEDPRQRTRKLPARIQSLLSQTQLVGKHLQDVKEGKRTVQEIIHAENGAGIGSIVHIGRGAIHRNHKSAPMDLNEILEFFRAFLRKLNSSNIKNKRATFHGIWSSYHELVVKWLYPWDQEVRLSKTFRAIMNLYVDVQLDNRLIKPSISIDIDYLL